MHRAQVLVNQGSTGYPARLSNYLGKAAPAITVWRGEPDIWCNLDTPLLALSSSTQAPAGIMLRIHDLAQGWRTGRPTIISGFHSPVEREVLEVLLRGPQPMVVCPARGIGTMRVKPAWQEPLAAGRLLLLSPFDDKVRRMTRETATYRNRFVAALADQVLIAHARPGSKTEALAREVLEWGKPLYTLDHPANHHLLELGAKVFQGDS